MLALSAEGAVEGVLGIAAGFRHRTWVPKEI
jgi:hypothetical protein